MNRSNDLTISRGKIGEPVEVALVLLLLVALRADGVVLLASVHRQYFRVELRTTFDKMDWMTSFTTSMAPLVVGDIHTKNVQLLGSGKKSRQDRLNS